MCGQELPLQAPKHCALGASPVALCSPAPDPKALGETTGASSQGFLVMAIGRWGVMTEISQGIPGLPHPPEPWRLGSWVHPCRLGKLVLAGTDPSMNFRVVMFRK